MSDKQIDEALEAIKRLTHAAIRKSCDLHEDKTFQQAHHRDGGIVVAALERQRESITLDSAANIVCRDLPEGCEISLCLESGAAWVALACNGRFIQLPDAADKTLWEQIQDALAAASTLEDEDD